MTTLRPQSDEHQPNPTRTSNQRNNPLAHCQSKLLHTVLLQAAASNSMAAAAAAGIRESAGDTKSSSCVLQELQLPLYRYTTGVPAADYCCCRPETHPSLLLLMLLPSRTSTATLRRSAARAPGVLTAAQQSNQCLSHSCSSWCQPPCAEATLLLLLRLLAR